MTHNETTQMMCRGSMWRGFKEKVEAKTMSHTKDKWVCDGLKIWATDRGVIARCPVPDKGGVFECEANARLIAAAPQLLDACKKQKEADDYYGPADVLHKLQSEAKELREAAIAVAAKG